MEGTIFVTGGAGFIARALYRRAQREGWRARFIAFGHSQARLVDMQKKYQHVRIVPGDIVSDLETLAAAMSGADFVIHAAAVKYVDLSEHSAFNTVAVNVDGSRNVANAAASVGIERVVGISTDKACQPVNVYGMSKAVMERLFVEADRWDATGTEFVCVRYGNVIGSTGSVIPLFRDQLRRLGHVELTDPKMTRFWMAADEAIDLIEIAATKAQRGSVVTKPPAAADMATVVAAAAPGAEVLTVGLRPGEKMHEDLVHFQESVRVQEVDDWLEVRPPGEVVRDDAFVITSSKPARWLSPEEIRLIADDAETI